MEIEFVRWECRACGGSVSVSGVAGRETNVRLTYGPDLKFCSECHAVNRALVAESSNSLIRSELST